MSDTVYGDLNWYKHSSNLKKTLCETDKCGHWSSSCQGVCNPCKSPTIIGEALAQRKWPYHSYANCLTIPSTAGVLSGLTPSKVEWSPNQIKNYSLSKDTERIIRVHYKLSDFDSWDKVKVYFNKYIAGKPEYKDQLDKLMLYFISNVLATSGCTNNPKDGTARSKCAQIYSSSEAGQFCQKWYQTTSSLNRDIIAGAFCNKFQDLPECDCMNRSSNPTYNALRNAGVGGGKGANQFPDCCWWKPCTNSSNYFVKTKNQPQNCKNCPKNICQQIVSIFKNSGSVSLKGITGNVDCKFETNGGKSGDNGGKSGDNGGKSGDNGGGGDSDGGVTKMPLWERIIYFAVPITIFVVVLLIFEFPGAKEFIRVHHVAFGLGFLIVSIIGGLVFWYYAYGPGKKKTNY